MEDAGFIVWSDKRYGYRFGKIVKYGEKRVHFNELYPNEMHIEPENREIGYTCHTITMEVDKLLTEGYHTDDEVYVRKYENVTYLEDHQIVEIDEKWKDGELCEQILHIYEYERIVD